MSKQTIIIFAGGLFIVLIAALLTQSLLQEEVQEQVIVEDVTAPTEILVAAAPISKGDRVSESSVRWMQWPDDVVFTGAYIRGGDIDPDTVDMPTGVSRRSIEEGQIILTSDLADDDTGNFVAATLSEGMRAYTIEINTITGVSGFVKPGDYVDVILAYDVNMPPDGDIAQAAIPVVTGSSTQTVIENAKVMAIDQTATEIEGVVTARTITLELTPEAVETLALAGRMGSLSIALRKTGDDVLRTANGQRPRATTDVRLSNAVNEVMGGGDGLLTVHSLGQRRSVYFLRNEQNVNILGAGSAAGTVQDDVNNNEFDEFGEFNEFE